MHSDVGRTGYTSGRQTVTPELLPERDENSEESHGMWRKHNKILGKTPETFLTLNTQSVNGVFIAIPLFCVRFSELSIFCISVQVS